MPDAETDPAGFVLAVAGLRERRAMGAQPGPWQSDGGYLAHPDPMDSTYVGVDAEHIAAESNPAHALAEVALWRGVVERHGPGLGKFGWCDTCGKVNGSVLYPCPDLLAVVVAARAYLGGGAA